VSSALSALRRVFVNPDIRRAELAWMIGYAAEWAWLVASSSTPSASAASRPWD
jgi:hypothetical protein